MEKKLTVEIAEGLGNQLLMYYNEYSHSKKLNYKIQIDNTSAPVCQTIILFKCNVFTYIS